MKRALFFSKFSFKNLKTLHFQIFLPKSCKFHSLEITILCASEKKTFPTLTKDASNTLTMSASTHGNEGSEYPSKRARAAPVLAPDSRRTEPAAPVGFVEVVRIETLEREVQTLEREVQTLEREVQTLEREVRTLRTAAEVKACTKDESDNDDDDESDLARSTRKTINGNKQSYLHFVHQLGLTADRMSSRNGRGGNIRSKIEDKVKDIYMRVRFSKETRTFGLTYWLRGVRLNTHRALVEFLGGWTETNDDKQLDPPRDGGYFTLHDISQLWDRQVPDRPDVMDIAMEIAIEKKRKIKVEQKDKDDQTLAEMQANL